MTQLFNTHTQEQHTQANANFLPNGALFEAKNIIDSLYRKFLRGLAGIFQDIEQVLISVSDDIDFNSMIELLSEWERAVGLPNHCFDTTDGEGNPLPDATRRTQIQMILAHMNLVTDQDFIDFALDYLGLTITVETGHNFDWATWYDASLIPTQQEKDYTMIINYENISTHKFTYTFSVFDDIDPPALVFDEDVNRNLLECVFRPLVPACVTILFIPSL